MIGYGIGNSRVEYHPKSVKKEVKVQFEFLTLNSHGSTSQTQNFGLLDNRPPSLSRSIKLELLHIVIYEKRREVRYTILKYFAIFQKNHARRHSRHKWFPKGAFYVVINGPNHLLLAMLTFGWQHCQCFCLKLPNSVRNAKKFFEAMPLAMSSTKSLQHCQDQMIRANMCKLLGPFLIL